MTNTFTKKTNKTALLSILFGVALSTVSTQIYAADEIM